MRNTHRKRERENYTLSRYLTKSMEAFKVCPDPRRDRQRDKERNTHRKRERENYNLSRYLTKSMEAFKVCPDSRT